MSFDVDMDEFVALQKEVLRLREALEWCRAAFDTAIAGRPHPAVAEMRACVDAVLRPSEDTSDES